MESAFQFTNPILVGLEFGLNQEFEVVEDHEVQIQINMSVNVNKMEDTNEAEVTLKLELGERGANSPFFISVMEAARFRWDESLESDMVNKLLNQNAPSLLLSYIRPIVTQVTAASPFDAYNIPFINFTNKKTKEK
jgi:preprotein translocase subunit SecB